MLVREIAGYCSGFEAISLHAEAAVLPELNPGPNMPRPVVIPAISMATPEIMVLGAPANIKPACVPGKIISSYATAEPKPVAVDRK